jgi:DNA polymerase-3 subunit gamma/tau
MYLALYRKYRPNNFDDVISQEHITTTLKNQIATGQIAHAYLFTGTRGTGKTSCAKIMAKAVNCLSPINGNPCGSCKACKAIAEGSTDIIEIDAASNNGVDSIRQIRDEVIYTPIDCKYKVYIIDEVHMLSDSAFNALLKTLEEPPEHAVFILATTEYYKVPATILSRCQQFLFSKIDPEAAKKRLLEVAGKENIKLTENAAALIARLSDGAMRDAWSLLDQCISAEGGAVDEEAVRKCGGVADSGYLFSVSEAAAAQNPADALKLLDELITKGKDISRFIEELTLHYRNLMLTKSVGAAFVKGTDEELKRYSEQCKKLSSDEIMRQVDLISDSLDNINRMKQTGQGRLLTEQLLIRLCSPRLSNDSSSLAARLGALENRLNNLYASDLVNHTDNPERTSDISAASTSIPDKPETASAPYSVSPSEGTSGESDKNTNALDTLPLDIDGIPFPEPPPDIGYEYVPFIDAPSSSPIPVTVSVSDSGALTRPESSEYLKTEPPAHDKTDVNRDKEKSYTEEPENNTDAEKSAPKEKREEENVPASPKSAEKSESLPIPESDMELPTDCKPLAQWEDITAQLPASSRNILKNVKAYLYGGKIYVESTPSSLSMMKSGRRAAKLRDAVHLVMGGKLDIFTLPEKVYKEDIKEDLVTPFLDRAREMGIEVTVKDK